MVAPRLEGLIHPRTHTNCTLNLRLYQEARLEPCLGAPRLESLFQLDPGRPRLHFEPPLVRPQGFPTGPQTTRSLTVVNSAELARPLDLARKVFPTGPEIK